MKKDNNLDLNKLNEKVNDVLKYINEKKMHYIELKVLESILHERCSAALNKSFKFEKEQN